MALAVSTVTVIQLAPRVKRVICTLDNATVSPDLEVGGATSAKKTTGATPGWNATRATVTRREPSPSSVTTPPGNVSVWKVRGIFVLGNRLIKSEKMLFSSGTTIEGSQKRKGLQI